MIKYRYILLFCFYFCKSVLFGQWPQTDLYLLELDNENNLSKISYLNAFNKNGYNNQPSFKDADHLLVVSNYSDVEQTDILLLNLSSNKLKRLTNTSESEFSPKVYRNTEFSVVKVLNNGEQVVWTYPMSLEDDGEMLYSMDDKVGYYQMLPDFKMAFYRIIKENQNALEIADLRRNTSRTVNLNIGRCLLRAQDGNLIYVTKDNPFLIKKYHGRTGKITTITELPHNVEDFALYKNDLIYAHKSKIYRYRSAEVGWKEWIDLNKLGISNITRITTNDNKIVLVNKK